MSRCVAAQLVQATSEAAWAGVFLRALVAGPVFTSCSAGGHGGASCSWPDRRPAVASPSWPVTVSSGVFGRWFSFFVQWTRAHPSVLWRGRHTVPCLSDAVSHILSDVRPRHRRRQQHGQLRVGLRRGRRPTKGIGAPCPSCPVCVHGRRRCILSQLGPCAP